MTFPIGYIIFALLIAPAGIGRRLGFWKSFGICLLTTPLIGLFIIMNSGRKDAKGCKHCGNKYNEVEFCGVCGLNEAGLTREAFNDSEA